MSKFPIYSVIVERSNNERVVAEVPEYEIEILKALHGEYNVFPGDVAIFEDERPDAAAEILEGLRKKYNNPSTGDVVMLVYRNADELAKAAGIKTGKAAKKVESVQEDNRGARAKAAGQSAELNATVAKAERTIEEANAEVATAKAELADAKVEDAKADPKAK